MRRSSIGLRSNLQRTIQTTRKRLCVGPVNFLVTCRILRCGASSSRRELVTAIELL